MTAVLFLLYFVAVENECQCGAALGREAAIGPTRAKLLCLRRTVGLDKAALPHRQPFAPRSEHGHVGLGLCLLGLDPRENVAAGGLVNVDLDAGFVGE